MKRSILFGLSFILLMALAGCGLRQPTTDDFAKADYGPYPENYEELVKAHINETFFDPYSIRDLWIGPPSKIWYNVLGSLNYCYAGQLTVNGKNRMGAYVGKKTFEYRIKYGRVIDFFERLR